MPPLLSIVFSSTESEQTKDDKEAIFNYTLVRNFLGVFFTIILAFLQKMDSCNVFAHTVAFILGAINPTRTIAQAAGQKSPLKAAINKARSL